MSINGESVERTDKNCKIRTDLRYDKKFNDMVEIIKNI
jgi:hypothetical protein